MRGLNSRALADFTLVLLRIFTLYPIIKSLVVSACKKKKLHKAFTEGFIFQLKGETGYRQNRSKGDALLVSLKRVWPRREYARQ